MGHWESSSIVSHYSEFVTVALEIDFEAVKPPNYSPNVCAVDNWKPVLKSLIQKYQPKLEGAEYHLCMRDVISAIEKHLAANKDSINPIYQDFLNAQPRWRGTIHCEAALAAIVLYAILKLEGHDDVKSLMEVSPSTYLPIMIA
jgi:hypothetical protein